MVLLQMKKMEVVEAVFLVAAVAVEDDDNNFGHNKHNSIQHTVGIVLPYIPLFDDNYCNLAIHNIPMPVAVAVVAPAAAAAASPRVLMFYFLEF